MGYREKLARILRSTARVVLAVLSLVSGIVLLAFIALTTVVFVHEEVFKAHSITDVAVMVILYLIAITIWVAFGLILTLWGWMKLRYRDY